MITAVDIKAELAGRPVLHARTRETPDAQTKTAFAVLAPFGEGSVFAGSFSGETKWERHGRGDELVHVLDGAAELTIMTADGAETVDLRAGMLVVVPQGHWHRFRVPERVTVLTATPQPTEHTAADDPRSA
jgi:mannose-6-phosphate isomerase-like protein (cupin superfamily)